MVMSMRQRLPLYFSPRVIKYVAHSIWRKGFGEAPPSTLKKCYGDKGILRETLSFPAKSLNFYFVEVVNYG
jgi:hypothetical protein